MRPDVCRHHLLFVAIVIISCLLSSSLAFRTEPSRLPRLRFAAPTRLRDARQQSSAPELSPSCRIKVIGVGGGGGNAVNRMIESGRAVERVEMWATNTDAQALSRNLAPNKLNIGKVLSR